MYKKLITFLMLIVMTMLMSVGCSNEQAGSSSDEAAAIVSQTQMPEQSVPENVTESIIPIHITVINTCGSDIGMFSIIDPATKEQINLAQIENQSTITIGANWPTDETELFWAIYNVNGELCIEGSSDITGITKSALIVLNGEGNVTDVKLTVE